MPLKGFAKLTSSGPETPVIAKFKREFDEITSLAAKIFDVPIAIITLVDTDRIWFKSSHGLDVLEIPREVGLCSFAIMSNDIYIVEDARADPRTLANSLLSGSMSLQFYAAALLKS